MAIQSEATEFRLPSPGRRPAQADDDPSMRAYCTTLARFVSSVHSTELTLGDYATTAREEEERTRRTSAAQERMIEKSKAESTAATEEAATARATYGVERHGEAPSGSIGFGAAAGELPATLATVARGREELRQATESMQAWTAKRDALTTKLVRLGAAAAALAMAVLMISAGGTEVADIWSSSGLALLSAGVAVSGLAGLAVGVLRHAAEISRGPVLTRTVDLPAAARHTAIVASYTAMALLLVRVVSIAIL